MNYVLNAESQSDGKHTILLVQFTAAVTSRTYYDFETVPEAMNGVIKLYEQKLKQLNPSLKTITYDIADLFGFIDAVGDISALM